MAPPRSLHGGLKEKTRRTGDVEIADGMHARAGLLALDSRMADERAPRLLDSLPEGQFLLKLKFIREQQEGERVVEDKFDPVWAERKKGQGIIEVSRDTKPGVLTGIDSVFYQNAYPATAVVYGLYPIRDPDSANLVPLRDGDLNCVAQRVMKHFEGALGGQGLTSVRRWKLQDWERGVHELLVTSVDDIAELEKILKRAIVLRDIAGEDIFNSGKYGRDGHGGHRIIEHMPKRPRLVQRSPLPAVPRGPHLRGLCLARQGEPLAVWLLGGRDRRLSVDQFVLQDGCTYRAREAHERLREICAGFGDPKLADRAFGENHAASIMAKEKNGWKPTPGSLLPDIEACVEHGHGGLWNSMGYDTREVTSIDMKACYPASFQGMGEAKPYFERFGHPTHRMTRVAINSALPKDIGTGFAEVQEWEFEVTCHPIIPVWFGRHFARPEGGWAPTQLLAFLTESGLLRSLKIRRRSSPSRIRLRSGCPRAGTRPAPSSANSHRAPKPTAKD